MEMSNVVTMVCFAIALMEKLKKINQGKFSLDVRLAASLQVKK